ncbi:thiaminase II [Comamonas piscis]|uniref:Aminopyrimidine aminohydrolase n=1 Tax=Comamonas piscis TaxID=1562974 RepID=A0A7G5EKM0_9BURK|nr:thiaminase II [Comamonas piscis]QMV74545.1 thiaminase II [Comamonas piscis]WSO33003.1 thiaminase II [Comamonas piscis]
MSFCQGLWQANQALYQRTLDHPFNRELAAGSLSVERFRHYMIQDAHYLVAYGRALAVAAAKADQAEGVVQFANAANEAVVEERKLHDGFMRDFGISAQDFATTPLTPACHHYTSFLLANSWSESYPVALAGLLPCFWIYAEVGRDIHARSQPGNPYQAWVDTYASEEFHAAVRAVIATIDRVADAADSATRTRMAEAYRYSAELEWMFWDSAYQESNWPTR